MIKQIPSRITKMIFDPEKIFGRASVINQTPSVAKNSFSAQKKNYWKMVHNQADPLTVSPTKNDFLIPEKKTGDALYEQADPLANHEDDF